MPSEYFLQLPDLPPKKRCTTSYQAIQVSLLELREVSPNRRRPFLNALEPLSCLAIRAVYAHLLGSKIRKHNSKVYLVNTGWIGGPYGIGKRIDLKYTRTIVSAILNDLLDKQPLRLDPIFNIHVPVFCPGVHARNTVSKIYVERSKEYQKQAQSLANMFVRNFSRFSDVADCLNKEGPYQK